MTDFAPQRAAFRALHEAGCFVMPNPWDRGSAIALASLGFKAIASSSAGFAFTRGLPDDAKALPVDDVLDHLRDLCTATALPVNADFQSGYGDDAEGVAHSVERCVQTGVAGLSIEDASGDERAPLFDLDVAIARLRAARAAIDRSKSGVVLTARAECFLVGHADPLAESVRRLRAYADAGADVLYAPGVRDREGMRAIVEAVAPKPVNVLIGWSLGLGVDDVASLGVRRISVGAALARTAWTAFLRAAREIAHAGDFRAFDAIVSSRDLDAIFARGRS
jgi:2-methylisocitrate lyase-like PEP mutase family enzyme